jgi:hypothetical protein
MSIKLLVDVQDLAPMPRRPGEVFAYRLLDRIRHGEQERLADLAGMSVASFSKWRSWASAQREGVAPPKTARYPNPSLTELERIAAVLEVAPAHLISDEIGPDGYAPLSPQDRLDLERLRALEQQMRDLIVAAAKGGR